MGTFLEEERGVKGTPDKTTTEEDQGMERRGKGKAVIVKTEKGQ